ncbi:hypothetical protein B0H11DRAFT_1918694 [Mycena galericulata]|nr:hypothetical protein B0H11DRAFT_1918694 [Mycena galericulata]
MSATSSRRRPWLAVSFARSQRVCTPGQWAPHDADGAGRRGEAGQYCIVARTLARDRGETRAEKEHGHGEDRESRRVGRTAGTRILGDARGREEVEQVGGGEEEKRGESAVRMRRWTWARGGRVNASLAIGGRLRWHHDAFGEEADAEKDAVPQRQAQQREEKWSGRRRTPRVQVMRQRPSAGAIDEVRASLLCASSVLGADARSETLGIGKKRMGWRSTTGTFVLAVLAQHTYAGVEHPPRRLMTSRRTPLSARRSPSEILRFISYRRRRRVDQPRLQIRALLARRRAFKREGPGLVYITSRVPYWILNAYLQGRIQSSEFLDALEVKVGHTRNMARRQRAYHVCAKGIAICWHVAFRACKRILSEAIAHLILREMGAFPSVFPCPGCKVSHREYVPLRSVGSFNNLVRVVCEAIRKTGQLVTEQSAFEFPTD